MRGFLASAMLPTAYRRCSETLPQLLGGALRSRRGRQAHEVVWMLRWVVGQTTEWQIPVFVLDCDVAAAFCHVSRRRSVGHGGPPWIREYRNSETVVRTKKKVRPTAQGRTRGATTAVVCPTHGLVHVVPAWQSTRRHQWRGWSETSTWCDKVNQWEQSCGGL